MLEDRDYMRQPEPGDSGWRPSLQMRWSWTTILLVVYASVFVTELAVNHFFPHNLIFNSREVLSPKGIGIIPAYLPLSLEGLEKGFVWQLITYQFLHAGWLHLLLNCWVIYMFGRELEHLLGARKYLALLFSSGVIGGVVQMLVAFVWPWYFGTHVQNGHLFVSTVVGASAAGYGLIAAFAAMFPRFEMQMLLFFIIPINIRARTFLIGSAVVALAGFAYPNVIMPGVAHAAHLGGMAMGWWFVRKILSGNWRGLDGYLHPAENKTASRQLKKTADEDDAASFSEEKVNAILDKISARGIQSLTKRERETLENARKQLGEQ